MSIETITWAKKQNCGCPYAKAVLLELANWARPNGVCEYRRVRDISAVIEISERSVQRALKLLEAHPEEQGLGLIKRITRYREDGGQQANRFELIGYIYRGDCQSPPSDELASGGCPADRDWGDQPVTPEFNQEFKKKNSPHSPRIHKQLRQPISSDWQAPSIQSLPFAIQALACQWTPAIYQEEAEAFHQYWLGTAQRRADWDAMWAARVQSQHYRAMKSAMAVSQEPVRPLVSISSPIPIAPPRSAMAQVDEDWRSASLRQALRERVGERHWAGIFVPAAYIFDQPGLMVFVTSVSCQRILENQFLGVLKAFAQSIDPAISWVRIETEARQIGKAK